MSQELNTAPTGSPALAAEIALPYTLTAGRAASVFLAELANRRIVGSKCPDCERVLAPAQDFCGYCGGEAKTLLELPSTGTLTAFTETASGLLALVRLDGADTDMVHRVLDASHDGLEIGQRVVARWADEPEGSVLDLAGFALAEDSDAEGSDSAGPAEVRELRSDTEPLAERPYRLSLGYQHAYGPYYGRLFDELATSRRILGVRCPSCESVLVPPREYCEACYVRTREWVDLPDTGVLQAFSVIHLEFVGQVREPPYVYAEIVLDGAATRMIHTIGIDPDEAVRKLEPGMRVRAVWKDEEPKGTLEDIAHFEPVEDE